MDTTTVTARPVFAELSADDNQGFLRKQAEYEAAYRRTGEPLALLDALVHAWSSRQTVPCWLVWDIGEALIKLRTDDEARRYRERMHHARRYQCVRGLRWRGYTKDRALDAAVELLKGESAEAERSTIEKSYDLVNRDLKRRGQESEFFYLVGKLDEPFGRQDGDR
jgi:hypothetical protein